MKPIFRHTENYRITTARGSLYYFRTKGAADLFLRFLNADTVTLSIRHKKRWTNVTEFPETIPGIRVSPKTKAS